MTKKKQPDKCINLVDWSATIFTYFTVDGQRTMTVCVKHIRCAGARKSLFRFADKMKKLTKTNVSFIASMWGFFNSWEMFDIDYMYRWTVFRQRVYWCSSMATFHYDVNMMSTFYEINMHTVLKKQMQIIVLLWLLNATEYQLLYYCQKKITSAFKWYG